MRSGTGSRRTQASKFPVSLLAGDKSPAHLGERLALQQAIPRAGRLTMHGQGQGQGHNAERTAPARVAEAVARVMN
jgi:hypothetical protein